MPQSLHANFAHLVFSTKNRKPIISGDIAGRIHRYLAGIVKDQGAEAVAVNGMSDHVHLLIKSSKNVADATFMKELKGGSSRWINANQLVLGRFGWQAGYGWFSVSPQDTDAVADYVRNQAADHKTRSFQDEFLGFLEAYQIDYDERYVWD